MDSFGVFLLLVSKSLDSAFWSSKVVYQMPKMEQKTKNLHEYWLKIKKYLRASKPTTVVNFCTLNTCWPLPFLSAELFIAPHSRQSLSEHSLSDNRFF